jgi:phosphate-selective porin OprO/OprP
MSLLHFPAKFLLAFLLSVCLCFFPGLTTGRAEEPPNTKERMLRMEHDIRALHQKNEDLERELRRLRQAVEENRDITGDAPRGDVIKTENPEYDLRLGGRITGRYTALVSDHPMDDEFSLERARLFTNVSLLDHYRLRIQVEFAEDPELRDGYLEVDYIPWARFRLGQFKVPFTLENQQSHKYIDFTERSLAVDNMRFPARDIGIMLHGQSPDHILEYQLAVLNGVGENQSDDNSSKDVAGRLVFWPFRNAKKPALAGAQLGVSGTWGSQDTDFSSREFLTVGGTPFVDFASNTVHKGNRSRLGTEFAWAVGPALLKTEWMWMWLDDFRIPSAKEDLRFYAGYVSTSYLLTGERKTLNRIVPEHPFSPPQGGWGAWELAARYSLFHSDDDLFRLGLASGTSRADTFAIGLNWYLNEILRLTLNYEHAEFDDDLLINGEVLDDEDVFLLQTQLEF